MGFLARVYATGACYLSWVLFGVVGFGLNLVCAPLLLWPDRGRFGPVVRRAIQRLFALWCGWLHASHLVKLTWRGFDGAPAGPAVYVADHPGLMDATYLLAKLPDTICIFKPALLRNPAVGPAAIMAGYVSGDTGVDLIRDAARKVAAGRSLLIFPEGTRTDPGSLLNPLKPGFALIAERAGAPVRVVVIRASRDLGAKGRPWWKIPRVPATVEVAWERTFPTGLGQTAAELSAEVQAYLLRRLREEA